MVELSVWCGMEWKLSCEALDIVYEDSYGSHQAETECIGGCESFMDTNARQVNHIIEIVKFM